MLIGGECFGAIGGDRGPRGAGSIWDVGRLRQGAVTDALTMPRRPAAFRQSDLTRALRAANAAGLVVDRVEIDPNGRIVIVARGAAGQTETALDQWLADNAHSRSS